MNLPEGKDKGNVSNDMRESILENMRLVIDAKQEVPKDEL